MKQKKYIQLLRYYEGSNLPDNNRRGNPIEEDLKKLCANQKEIKKEGYSMTKIKYKG